LWASFAFDGSSEDGLPIFLREIISIFSKDVKFIMVSIRTGVVQLPSIILIGLLERLIDLDWRHELPLGEQRVNLLDKLKSGVLLVQNQSINIIDHNWNLSSLEEQLQQLPIILLLLVVLGVVETMHLDLLREVPREHFGDEEAVVESSSDVFD